MSNVRLAQWEDLENFVETFAEAHSEVGLYPLNRKKLYWAFDAHMNNRGIIIGVMGEPGEKLEALIMLSIEPLWYSDSLRLTELIVHVRKDLRKSTRSNDLLLFVKDMSELLKLNAHLGISNDVRRKAKERLYRRSFKEIGMQFAYIPSANGVE